MHFVCKHCRHETWAYTALVGIISFHVGIVVAIFAFEGLLVDEQNSTVLVLIGVIVALVGLSLVITSGVLYRRKRRRLPPCLCCGDDDDDTASVVLPPFRRLRFAPNLVSPYYIDVVLADSERKSMTDNRESENVCPNQLFETFPQTWQSTGNVSTSQTFAADTAYQASPSRKEHRKTPC